MRHPFLRTLAGSAAAATDPNFENVTLLLHGDGTNGGQNNTFVDGSTNNFTITRNGNTTQGTFSPYGDNWSNYFDGTGDDLSLTGQNLSATDWTVECWVYFQSFSNSGPHLWNFGTDINNRYNVWRNSTTGTFSFTRVNGGSYDVKNGTTSPVVGRWYHIAVVRVNSTGVQTLYVDGVAEVTNTGSISTGTTWTIGFVPGGATADRMLGYISNFRVVTSAVYTANFTPPTAPLTAITNTSLLTCSTNRFRDVSSNNRTITRNGDVSVQRFSPFSPTAAYEAGTIGASGQSDGSGDYLTVADNTAFHFGSGNFTIEAWVYLTDNQGGTTKSVTSKFEGNAGTGPWALWIQATTLKPRFYVNYGAGFENRFLEGSAVDVASWCHLAVVRNGSTITLYQNGTSTATLAVSTNSLYVDSGVVVVLDDRNFTRNLKGSISDLRIVKGSAVYTAGFTPPTSPLSSITNTSLLLNFTNAAILDNAMMAVPETVGNAQIDTTTKKYGTGSLKFDGTGDGLKLPFTPEFVFGSGNFTVECWVYVNSLSAARDVFNLNARATNGYASVRVNITTAGAVYLLCASADQTWINTSTTANSTIATGNWYHIAAVRNGSSFNLYVDGVSKLNYTSSATLHNYSSISFIGAENSSGSPITVMDGYIDDFRITKGVARYTSNFTPPTAALPDL